MFVGSVGLWVKCSLDTPTYFLRTSLAWHKGIKLPFYFRINHSNGYPAQGWLCLERGASAMWCVLLSSCRPLKPETKVTISFHKAYRTVHMTYRGARPQSTCTSTMPQKSEDKKPPHKHIMGPSGVPCAEAASGKGKTDKVLQSFLQQGQGPTTCLNSTTAQAGNFPRPYWYWKVTNLLSSSTESSVEQNSKVSYKMWVQGSGVLELLLLEPNSWYSGH